MKTEIQSQNGVQIAQVESAAVLITDAQSALDLLFSVQHETGCSCIALNKEAVDERFFDLRTGLAGEVLQKFINYRMRFAVYGDFSRYTSKALCDFIRESNRGRHIFFVPTAEEAVQKLAFSG